ncbi:MAG: Nramp family divalent metal transporter [Pirellulales bacterium]|nr:Nramp family divalent metal transporter [Pirellulales bacterium]
MSAPTTPHTEEHPISLVQHPPHTVGGILRRLGPGLIIAGSIVGSGELIGTTKTGAEAGTYLLWLIVIGCVIKVFVQVEFGRYSIGQGRTSMEGMNDLPGPHLRVSWLMWYWVFMFALGLGQLGAIVGGVGQSLSMTFPITGDFNRLIEQQREYDLVEFPAALEQARKAADTSPVERDEQTEVRLLIAAGKIAGARPTGETRDDIYWSSLVTLITSVLLVIGRYNMIQNVSVALVAMFTGMTVFNLLALQYHQDWALTWDELRNGFSFRLPPNRPGTSPVGTALATFGIIGVGASELIAYPYWCLEKGYARFTGPRTSDESWAVRARGWMRVMRWDAWCSMVVYTLATVAFYLLGAGVLHRANLNPSGNQMIATLAEMYRPVFGEWAAWIFLLGAFAVLYSTFFIATAGNARMASDALRIFRLSDGTPRVQQRWVSILSGVFPFVSLSMYLLVRNPVGMVLASGMAQSVMLPMLGFAGLYFRYRRCDRRIMPGGLWDLLLWLSVGGLLLAGGWGIWTEGQKAIAFLSGWLG